MAQVQYGINDPQGLNIKFYTQYDESFLFRKADTLLFIAEHQEHFREFVTNNGGQEEAVDSKFIETIRTEVHFTEFHQFEAFFALLIAIFQNLPHWLYLTTYSTRDIKKKVKAFLEDDIKTLTEGNLDSTEAFVNQAIYTNFLPDDQDSRDNWKTNIENITWLLSRLSEKYIAGAEYNAYKHGVRIMTGPSSLSFKPTGKSEGGFSFSSNDSVRFLEIKDDEQDRKIVYETVKHFNPIESINHLLFMAQLLDTMKTTRLARLQGGQKHIEFNTFFDLDRDVLKKFRNRTRWSITI